jgi:hypothetical protein
VLDILRKALAMGQLSSLSGIASLTCVSVRLLWQQAGCKKWQGVCAYCTAMGPVLPRSTKQKLQAGACDRHDSLLNSRFAPHHAAWGGLASGMLPCIGRGCSGLGCCKASRLTRGGFSSSNDSTLLDCFKGACVCCTRVICDVQGLRVSSANSPLRC